MQAGGAACMPPACRTAAVLVQPPLLPTAPHAPRHLPPMQRELQAQLASKTAAYDALRARFTKLEARCAKLEKPSSLVRDKGADQVGAVHRRWVGHCGGVDMRCWPRAWLRWRWPWLISMRAAARSAWAGELGGHPQSSAVAAATTAPRPAPPQVLKVEEAVEPVCGVAQVAAAHVPRRVTAGRAAALRAANKVGRT